MAKGSIAVKYGDKVTVGQVLGDVGMSGLTEYPHLHFVVRRGGKVIDPFADGRAPGACNGNAENQWHESVRAQLAYSPRTILNFGFTSDSVTTESVESGATSQRQPTMNSEAIVAFVRTIGLKAGDVQILTLRDPAGKVLAENRPVRSKETRHRSCCIQVKNAPSATGPRDSIPRRMSSSRMTNHCWNNNLNLNCASQGPGRRGGWMTCSSANTNEN